MKRYYTYTAKPTRPTIKDQNKIKGTDFVYSYDPERGRPELLTIQQAAELGKFTYNADVENDIGFEPSQDVVDRFPLTLQMQTTTASESITLPMTGAVSVDIDWGDGTTETVTTDSPSHTFTSAGTYDIKVTGSCNLFSFDSSVSAPKLLHVLNGGTAFTAGSFNDGFRGCSNMTTADFSGLDTSNVTDMRFMFEGCSSLTSLDVSGFNTSSVTDMLGMFQGCSGLTSLDVTGFDTSKVILPGQMFFNCSGLTSLDVTGFDTSSMVNLSFMFEGCSSLTSLDVTGFDTSNVTSLLRMFRDCSILTALDVSGFNTSNVAYMQSTFQGCSSLTADPGIHVFDVTALITAEGMCDGANAMLSESEYNTILVNWEAQAVNDNVLVHFGDAVHSGAGSTARAALITDHTWTIADGGAAP